MPLSLGEFPGVCESVTRESNDAVPWPYPANDSQNESVSLKFLKSYISTGLQLGILNVGRVLTYRAKKKAGIYRWLLPRRKAVPLGFKFGSGTESAPGSLPWNAESLLNEAAGLLEGKANYFSAHTWNIGNPPNWFLNPFENKIYSCSADHWSKIPDFDPDAGDIKVIWEISRFHWALVFARAWRVSKDRIFLSTLQSWLEDWWIANPPNVGPNWMSGQEVSIRLINTLLACHLAGLEKEVELGLVEFVQTHCSRIRATTSYAIAQDNNHATSEAAGLFVGGNWLAIHSTGRTRFQGQMWAEAGRKLLENRVAKLVLIDGSFSQHSLTYHRMMLDTLSIAEFWRKNVGERAFTATFYSRASAATRWLGAMIDPVSGDGPNLGSNDGSHAYRLTASSYRDFRPCLQLASILFLSSAALESGPWDEAAAWLHITADRAGRPWTSELGSAIFSDGGYLSMRNEAGARVLLRAPTAKFRPLHADALHLDLWWKGENLLRDGGTYSYAECGALPGLLASVEGHNAFQFDGHDQMQKLGRFLYGDWVRVAGMSDITSSEEGQFWSGSYTDAWGATQKRSVNLKANVLSVFDQVDGFKRNAVLRWRLAPADWSQEQWGCASALGRLAVESSVPIRRIGLISGWESRRYLEKSPVPVLELEVDHSPAAIKTTITLNQS